MTVIIVVDMNLKLFGICCVSDTILSVLYMHYSMR